jgi:uncharacterized membrane protein
MAALLAAPLALAGLTVWTYLGVPGASRRRVAGILALRLAALALALAAMLRPSLAFSDRNQLLTLLLIACDASESMTIRDEFDSQSRWELLLRSLKESEPALQQLRDVHNVEVQFYRFAGDTAEFQPAEPGPADGKRTDIGGMLHGLYDLRDARRPPRALLVLSDGADNGTRHPALAEAARWRNLPCPVHTFAVGKPTTSDRQSDIALTGISADPATVPVKGKLTVKVTANAPGFENSRVRFRLFLDDKEVTAREATLDLTDNNEVKLECTAPATPGEVKVTVRVEDRLREGKPPPGDLIPGNNQIETFITVSKEGVSVLLVDKQRAWEPQSIYDALTADPRIRVTPVWLRGDRPLEGGKGDLFRLDRGERPYDVIILGDVTARQVRAVNPRALAEVEKLVSRGAGFLMIGGYASFGNSDWRGTEVEKLLPVDLSVRGQVESPVQMVPTQAGLDRYSYLLQLADGKDARAAWQQLPRLEGMTRLGRSRSGIDSVLATSPAGDPILVTQNYGDGRTMAFAGDSTHRWIRKPEGLAMHSRFWRHMVIWLAKQEDTGGSVWVKPDVRRLPAHSDVGFRVGVRSNGVDLKDGTFTAEVIGPDGERTPAAVARGGGEDRGTFARTDAPGVYRIVVRGEAKDPGTNKTVKDEGTARFLVYEEDLEMSRRAADHDFLKKLAAAGGGESHRVEELRAFLERLAGQTQARSRPRLNAWPNWRTTGRSPFFVVFIVFFVTLLTGEWVLRRRWGMV